MFPSRRPARQIVALSEETGLPLECENICPAGEDEQRTQARGLATKTGHMTWMLPPNQPATKHLEGSSVQAACPDLTGAFRRFWWNWTANGRIHLMWEHEQPAEGVLFTLHMVIFLEYLIFLRHSLAFVAAVQTARQLT